MRDPGQKPAEGEEPEQLFARVKVPPILPRLLAIGATGSSSSSR